MPFWGKPVRISEVAGKLNEGLRRNTPGLYQDWLLMFRPVVTTLLLLKLPTINYSRQPLRPKFLR